jgi:hypothetical protein
MRKHDGRIGFLAVFLACMENISYLCSMKEIKVTGTVCPIEYWTEGEDWLDTHCILLPFFSIKSVEGCKLKRKPVKKAYRELMAHVPKPWVIRKGKLVDGYTRTYYVPDDTKEVEIVTSIGEFKKVMMMCHISEYLVADGVMVEAADENELLAEDYKEFVVKR